MAIKEVIYTAVIIESERGWGQRIDEVKEFKTEKERNDFIKKFNAKNNKSTVPDWYEYAEAGKDILRDPKRKTKKKH